jgi:hypothetical protein
MLQGLDLLPMTRGFGSFFLVVIFFPERRWKSTRKSFSSVFIVSGGSRSFLSCWFEDGVFIILVLLSWLFFDRTYKVFDEMCVSQ